MSEAQSINAKISMPGQELGDRKLEMQLTLSKITSWIKMQGLDEYTTDGLIQIASTYPTQALPHFRKNFNLMVSRVRQKRKQEQLGLDAQIVKPIEIIEKEILDAQEDQNSASFQEDQNIANFEEVKNSASFQEDHDSPEYLS